MTAIAAEESTNKSVDALNTHQAKRPRQDFASELSSARQQMTEAFNHIKNNNLNDEYEIFGKLIASKIRKLQNINIKEILMNDIQNIVFKACMMDRLNDTATVLPHSFLQIPNLPYQPHHTPNQSYQSPQSAYSPQYQSPHSPYSPQHQSPQSPYCKPNQSPHSPYSQPNQSPQSLNTQQHLSPQSPLPHNEPYQSPQLSEPIYNIPSTPLQSDDQTSTSVQNIRVLPPKKASQIIILESGEIAFVDD